MFFPDREFPALMNDSLLRALEGFPIRRVPVWIMREPGNYLPEREGLFGPKFYEICHTPAIVSETTVAHSRRYNFDAAVLFSDMLLIPYALGMKVQMESYTPPFLPEPLSGPEDINKLKKIDICRELIYVYDAVTLTRHSLNGSAPLIGVASAPWTLMCYMIEGGYTKDKNLLKPLSWLYKWPEQSHVLLQLLKDSVIMHLVNQVVAGAQLLQLFESTAECLTPDLFKQFSLPYLREIKQRVTLKVEAHYGHKMVPMILYATGSAMILDLITDLGYEVLALDRTVVPSVARSKVPKTIFLQGNLDSTALTADHDEIKEMVIKMVEGFGTSHYIASLGDCICAAEKIPAENVALFVNTVHRESAKIIKKSKK